MGKGKGAAQNRRWLRWEFVTVFALILLNAFIIKHFIVDAPHKKDAVIAETADTPSLEMDPPPAAHIIDAIVPVEGDAVVTFGDQSPQSSAPKSSPGYKTVDEAAERACSTLSVKGLSEQIIAQGRCINPDAFVALSGRKNLVLGSEVFGVLQAGAHRHLTRMLDANPDRVLTLNSALRTLAQQYLVWRWGEKKRCGVQLAARPGTSNHERGLAIDIRNPQEWRKSLEAEKFSWMGESDRVHFDFVGSSKTSRSSADVLAFQKLWNLNHPEERLRETGTYDAATQRRLAQAPPNGFPKSARCGSGKR